MKDMMYHIFMSSSFHLNQYNRGPRWLMPLRGIAWLLLAVALVAGQATTLAHEADPFCDEELCELCEGGAGEPSIAPNASAAAGGDKFHPFSKIFSAPGHPGRRSVAMVRAPPCASLRTS